MTAELTPGPSWSDIADWYDKLLSAGSGPHETAVDCLQELLPDVEGKRVLDVACGQGIAARRLAALGATVTGTDYSAAMVENARRHGTPSGKEIEWIVEDAQTLASFSDDTFDVVTCQLALMDIPDLDAALASIARVLRPGGSLCFVIGHPCFLVPGATSGTDTEGRPTVTVGGYLDEHFWRSTNPEGVRRAGNFHRTISTYLNSLAAAGFTIVEVAEPTANERLATDRPLYRDIPMFFAAAVRSAH